MTDDEFNRYLAMGVGALFGLGVAVLIMLFYATPLARLAANIFIGE